MIAPNSNMASPSSLSIVASNRVMLGGSALPSHRQLQSMMFGFRTVMGTLRPQTQKKPNKHTTSEATSSLPLPSSYERQQRRNQRTSFFGFGHRKGSRSSGNRKSSRHLQMLDVTPPRSQLQQMEVCLDLLHSLDMDQNRVGLQKLMVLTKSKVSVVADKRREEFASYAIVYGGSKGSTQDRLRQALMMFLCDPNQDEEKESYDRNVVGTILSRVSSIDDDSSSDNSQRSIREAKRKDDKEDDTTVDIYDEYSIDDNDDIPRGQYAGALHTLALRIVVNALEQVVWESTETALKDIEEGCSCEMDSSSRSASSCSSCSWCAASHDFEMEVSVSRIDFADSTWKPIISSLIDDIETCHSVEIAGYSLKCFRLLHTLEPNIIAPLLRNTLLPFLMHLKDYGKSNQFPVIESEASRLLKRAREELFEI